MTKKERLRKLLEDASCNYEFSKYLDNIQKAVKNSYYQMRNYYARTDEERATVDTMYDIIGKVAKKEKIDFSKYSDAQLFDVLNLTKKELSGGDYTYDLGVLWYGSSQYDEILKLMEEIRTTNMSSNDKFVEIILNGNILDKLREDFSRIKLTDKYEYLSYINTYYRNYASYVFGRLGNYKLELAGINMLDPLSMENRAYTHLKLNKDIGFRVINLKTCNILKANTYGDIKRILSKV